MRTFFALTLFVYLAPACHAEDWATLHGSGLQAVQQNDFPVAAEVFARCRALAQTKLQRAVSDNDLGVVLHRLGREAEARGYLEKALESWKEFSDLGAHYAETASALALVDRMLGDYAASEAVLKSGLELSGISGDLRIHLLLLTGDLLRELGRYGEARVLLKQAEAIPPASPRQQVDAIAALAELDRDTQNWDASIAEWTRAIELAREKKDEFGEAGCIRGLGQTWLDRGNLARAEPLLRGALALYRAKRRPDDAEIAAVQASLGQLYLAEDKTGLAEESLRRALDGQERAFGPTHPQLAIVLEALADTVARRNQLELAREYMRRAETIMVGRFGENSLMTAGVFANWGSIEQRANQPDRAAAKYEKALSVLRTMPGDLDAFRLSVMKGYAQVLRAAHHKREAEVILAEAQGFRSK
jgi:tetratricopeptide (TPR) repeat protein